MKTKLKFARTFIETVQLGSISHAARALNITRSAASKHIHTLEESLGVQLLNRSTRSLSLTEAGKVYFEGLLQTFDQLQLAEDRIAQFNKEPAGTLVIESTVLFARKFLTPIIDNFLADHPKMKVDLRLNDHFSNTTAEGVDLFFRSGEVNNQDMVAIKVLDVTFLTVASPAYLAKHGTPERLDDLESHNCLNFRFPSDHSLFRWRFRHKDETVFKRFNGNFISTDIEEIRSLTLEGMGISQVPGPLVEDDIKRGTLTELFSDKAFASNSVFMCFNQKKRLEPKILSFKDHFQKHMPARGQR